MWQCQVTEKPCKLSEKPRELSENIIFGDSIWFRDSNVEIVNKILMSCCHWCRNVCHALQIMQSRCWIKKKQDLLKHFFCSSRFMFFCSCVLPTSQPQIILNNVKHCDHLRKQQNLMVSKIEKKTQKKV